MAAPSVAASSADSTGNTNAELTISFPTGTVSGSLLLLFVTMYSGGADPVFGSITDWTKLQESIELTTSDRSGTALYWRFADGVATNVTTVTSPSNAAFGLCGKILRVTGAHTSTPIHVSNSSTPDLTIGAGDPMTLTGLTTSVDDCLAVFLAGTAGVSTVTHTWTVATEQGDFGTDPGGASNLTWATKTQTVAGATGNPTVEPSGSCSGTGVAVALEPAPSNVSVTVGLASETDTAFAISVALQVEVAIGLASETATAFAVTPTLPTLDVTVGLAAVGDTAFGVTPTLPTNNVTLGLATEGAIAFALTVSTGFHALSPSVVYIEVEAQCELETDAEPVEVPDGAVWIKRIIRTAPNVILDGDRVDVQAWTEAFPDPVYADWGRLKVIIGGKDVTFFRGVPTQVISWDKQEPFGDRTAMIRFPQITPFEEIPSWLGDPENGGFRNIDIYQRHPDGVKDKIWEGMTASFEDDAEGLTIQCMGAIHQLGLYLRRARLVQDIHRDDIVKILLDLVTPYGREKRSLRFRPLTVDPPTVSGSPTRMGIEVLSHGGWMSVLDYVSELLGLAWLEDGSNQWTIQKDFGRKPVLRLKDIDTEHYSVHVGEPGVQHDLRLDLTQHPTTIFAEGTDQDHCRWINAKYPVHRYGDTSPFFGTDIGPPTDSSHGDSMLLFEREMFGRGWTGFTRDGIYTDDELFWVKRFQFEAGLPQTGIIDAATWTAAFTEGTDASDEAATYVAPVYSKKEVDLYNRAADGSKLEKNPLFDKNILRVERYEHMGAEISKREAMRSAKLEVQRDWPPSYFGTITLTTDPPEKSRFELLEGRNILFRGHKGVDRLMHISAVAVDFGSGSVTLTVDEKARDAMTVASMLARDRGTTDPFRRKERTYRNTARETQDERAIFDCENGAGIIPDQTVLPKQWKIIKIPAGKLGTINRSAFRLDTPSRMAVGIFDRSVTPQQMHAVGAGQPYGGDPLQSHEEDGYWDTFPDPTDPDDPRTGPEGLIIAWGSFDEPGGFWPGRFSDDDPVTGVLVDDAQWYFESEKPPWLWIAVWVESGDGSDTNSNHLWGRLSASNETT